MNSLDVFFAPKTVALIGASDRPGSLGRTLLWNLISHPFGGTVYPVNPKHENVLGIKSYKNIQEIAEKIELAVIATPAHTVLDIVRQCADFGVKGVLIVSAGFKETGKSGLALEEQILQVARTAQMRIIGPNCLGIMSPATNFNATFASGMAKTGKVAFLSQSGALCSAILDWSFTQNWGFSAFVSLGSMLDIGWADLIYYLGDDPQTGSIIIYMESIVDARSFLSAAREVALTKPIIVIKAGRTQAAAKAAASHTGSLSGSDQVLDAAFARCGVLRVDSIEELFNMAELLAKQPKPSGRRLSIITNAGGPGVLATDALIAGGGELSLLSSKSLERLNQVLPAYWSKANPIDILGDATAERYCQAIEIIAQDPNTDGILVILTPQDMSDPTRCAQEIVQLTKNFPAKPLLCCWMGGKAIASGEDILNRANIYTAPYPDIAARLFNLMWQYSANLNLLYETPNAGNFKQIDHRAIQQIISSAQSAGRSLLTEWESKEILKAYGFAVISTELADSPNRAVEIAQAMVYPVVLKLNSYTISHKSAVGGVKLNLSNAEQVIKAYRDIEQAVDSADFQGVSIEPMQLQRGFELILGSSIDSQFGPVLLFGSGGTMVEILQDTALGLPPLNSTLARRMIEKTKISRALQKIDLNQLELLLVRFSQLVVEQSAIAEIDINPLLALDSEFLVLDARIVLCENRAPLSIRAYLDQYIESWQLADGSEIILRPIRPEDEPSVIKFYQNISSESFYFRYFHLIKRQKMISHQRLARICFIDYDREISLVALSNQGDIWAIANLSKPEGKFALLVGDQYQGKGIGHKMLSNLLVIAKQEGLNSLNGEILQNNLAMQTLCQKLGFTLSKDEDIVLVKKDLV